MASQEITLALTSGGARGVAHIGVIEELELAGYTIKAIAGSSMGAVVAGMYAAGKLTEFKKWMLSLDKTDVFSLMDFTLSSQGLIKGDKVFNALKEITGDFEIEHLRIPFTAIAVDYKSKKEVWLQKGSLISALRASTAIPVYVTPAYFNDMELVDGGILNPAPISPLLEFEEYPVFLSNVNANIPYEPPPVDHDIKVARQRQLNKKKNESFITRMAKYLSRQGNGENNKDKDIQKSLDEKLNMLGLVNKTIEMMEDKIIALTIEKYQPQRIIEISRNAANLFDFYKAAELIAAGRVACRNMLSDLKVSA